MAVPGIIIAIQTYGDLVNFHPHLHALVTDGAFGPTGWFVAFPKIDLYPLELLFRHRVLQMLLRERRIDEPVIRKLLGWRHSGFSLHNAILHPKWGRPRQIPVSVSLCRIVSHA